jgi:hypothetical protein
MSFVRMLLGAAPLALAVTFTAGTASADVGKTAASGTGKGIVGGALLGGELVCSIEAIAGVQSPWAYVGGAVGGAAAGGVGGYFVEQGTDNARVPLLMLAGGMTLLIPTIVGVLSATAYRPPADYLTDQPRPDEPVANPPQSDTPAPAAVPPAALPPPAAPDGAPAGAPPAAAPPPDAPPATTPPATPPAGTTPAPSGAIPVKRRIARARRLPPLALVPPSLVALRPGALALSVPAVEIQNTYTRTEVAMYGVDQATEVHIPVLNVVF